MPHAGRALLQGRHSSQREGGGADGPGVGAGHGHHQEPTSRTTSRSGGREFMVDGVKVDERTSAPWVGTWDTSTVKNGYHAVRVEAWDAAGNQAEATASSEVAVYVGNNISADQPLRGGMHASRLRHLALPAEPRGRDRPRHRQLLPGRGAGHRFRPHLFAAAPFPQHHLCERRGGSGQGRVHPGDILQAHRLRAPHVLRLRGYGSYHWKGCHVAQGAHFPRGDWYFAEGCTRHGFRDLAVPAEPRGARGRRSRWST